MAALIAGAGTSAAYAQRPPDSLHLRVLLDVVEGQDPRQRQRALQAGLSRLRLDDLRAQWRPQVAFGGETTVQSEVARIEVPLPGVEVPSPPRTRVQATVDAQQLLYDGGRNRAQASLEEARRAEAEAGIGVMLFPLRLAVVEAFYAARLAEEQAALLGLQEADLAARLALARSRAVEGAGLRADAAALEAERLRARQRIDEATAARSAALAVLADLTGAALAPDVPLSVSDIGAEAERALAALDADTLLPGRPEAALFDARRTRSAQEAVVAGRAGRPQLAAIGQAGIGRPGLAQFKDRVHPFALVGLRARWNPLDWGAARRAGEASALQQALVDADEAAFVRGLRRDVADERAAIERLRRALETDEAIIAARREVERVARRQFEEGVALAADYAQRQNALYDALATRVLHRVQLAQARARLLVTLGQR